MASIKVDTTPRKKPKQARAQATVRAILQATAHILVEQGYDRLTTNHVAKRAGVSIGSLYQYFPSKEALVAALVEEHLEQMVDVVTKELALATKGPLLTGARGLVAAAIAMHRVNPRLHRVLMEQLPRVGGLAKIRELDERMTTLLAAVMVARRGELRVKNPEMAAYVLVHAVKGVVFATAYERPALFTDSSLEDELVELIERYISD